MTAEDLALELGVQIGEMFSVAGDESHEYAITGEGVLVFDVTATDGKLEFDEFYDEICRNSKEVIH